jgi:hypothetical protein
MNPLNKLTHQPDEDQQAYFEKSVELGKKVRESEAIMASPLLYTIFAHTLNQGVAAAQAKDWPLANKKMAQIEQWLESNSDAV